MRSLKFPKLFSGNTTDVWKSTEYLEATKQNAAVLLQCNRGELFCDPYYGTLFRQYLFDQNSYKIEDVLLDTIYTQLSLFIPQIKVNRNDIEIIRDQEKGKIYCTFSGVNQINYQLNTYQLVVFNESEI